MLVRTFFFVLSRFGVQNNKKVFIDVIENEDDEYDPRASFVSLKIEFCFCLLFLISLKARPFPLDQIECLTSQIEILHQNRNQLTNS